FDLFETLITEWGHKKYTKREMCEDLGIDKEAFNPFWEEKEQDRYLGNIDFRESILYACEKCGKKPDMPVIEKVIDTRVKTKSECFNSCLPEVYQMLETLKNMGLKTAIVSNCSSEEVVGIRESGIYKYFDEVILSYEVGMKKPDACIYLEALERLCIDPDDCLFVGDGGSNELVGAQEVGIKAVQAKWYTNRFPVPRGSMYGLLSAEEPEDVIAYISRSLAEGALSNWALEDPRIGERFHKDTVRLIYKVNTKTGDYLLKGFPDEVPESVILGNVRAHLFLGNEHRMAPVLYPAKNGEYYVESEGYRFYLMEFIVGRQMEETPEDEYKLGVASRKMHSLQGYHEKSPMNQSKEKYYSWFRDREFVKKYDEILDELPDFEKLDQCFVHTDIGPHNVMIRTNGEVVFIDLDDAGIGSRYLDIGWPFIMQFVDFNHDTEEMKYRFDLAKSFLKGYYKDESISREEFDLIFRGAIQMHISYMQDYGPYAVDSLWKILRFGMEQMEALELLAE
ncbi:MAG: HAD-IA family hydrolase, partial [Lachnospiraceae bacterium]|nr:HAD-IA family hydrolase [Lachnospiraceae bacterium]